jgi:hypothetical protein
MAFLDNSGDILLDAVLTDAGRKRMAEGTFRITKFALADDEIDYSLYNANDSRGSAYYDLDVLSTPVLEAFTDNAAGLKSKLLSISRTDLEYLPVMKLFEDPDFSKMNDNLKSFIVPVNNDTLDALFDSGLKRATGVLFSTDRRIAIDQGIDNEARSFGTDIDASLRETQFIIEIDNRLGIIRQRNVTNSLLNPAYLDDDDIASYIRTEDNTNFVLSKEAAITSVAPSLESGDQYPKYTSIRGQFGSRLEFSIAPSSTLQSNDFLFERIGGTFDPNADLGSQYSSNTVLYIDATVRVIGATTGYRLDIPVRFAKLQGSTGNL